MEGTHELDGTNGSLAHQHDEYQVFTDQFIDGQVRNNNLEQSHGYFKLTGMLRGSQLDQFNLSQLLKQHQLEN